MANTYTLISSNVLSSSAASVTFSAIPATYTDLVLRLTARTDRAAVLDIVQMQFNSSGGTAYSYTDLNNNGGATAVSGAGSNLSLLRSAYIDGNTATSNTFGGGEIYIPSYAGNTNKVASGYSVSETNATSGAYIIAYANLWRDTSAITSIALTPLIGPNFLSGSSFYLYGIKNS